MLWDKTRTQDLVNQDFFTEKPAEDAENESVHSIDSRVAAGLVSFGEGINERFSNSAAAQSQSEESSEEIQTLGTGNTNHNNRRKLIAGLLASVIAVAGTLVTTEDYSVTESRHGSVNPTALITIDSIASVFGTATHGFKSAGEIHNETRQHLGEKKAMAKRKTLKHPTGNSGVPKAEYQSSAVTQVSYASSIKSLHPITPVVPINAGNRANGTTTNGNKPKVVIIPIVSGGASLSGSNPNSITGGAGIADKQKH